MARAKGSSVGPTNKRSTKADANKPAVKQPPKPNTLMEATELNESVGRPAKRVRKRSLDDCVSKALADNFPTFTEVETDLTMVNGRSLRDTILDAKKRQRDGEAISIGKTLYSQLRDEYGAATDAGRRMVVHDPMEPEDGRLKEALNAMLRHNRDTTHIVQYLLHTKNLVSQKNFVALCRAFLMFPPMQSVGNATLVLELLRFCVRTGAHNERFDEMVVMRSTFDLALLKSFSNMKSQGQSCAVWWESVRDISGAVLDASDVDAVLACSTMWKDVKEPLLRVVKSSQTGAKMFASAHRQLQENSASDIVQAAVDSLKGQALTKDAIAVAQATMVTGLKAIGADASETFLRREIEFKYRGVALRTHVHSLMDEWTLRKESLVREAAVVASVLAPLWCEDELAPARNLAKVEVDRALLVETSRMRASASSFLPTMEEQTSANIEQVLQKRAAVLGQLDRYCRIESLFFAAHIGAGAEKRLQDTIMSCLPVTPAGSDIPTSLQQLKTVGDGKLVAFCGAGLQATFNTVRTFLQTLDEGRCPPWQSVSELPFWKKVKAAFANFLSHSPPAGSGAASPTLHGAAAAECIYEALDQSMAGKDKGTKLTYDQILPLIKFKWLLSEAQGARVNDWVNECMAARIVVATPALEQAAVASKKKGRKGASDMTGVVSSLFK